MKKVTVTPKTGRDSDKFMLRFPDGMRDQIKEAAEANNRSMNAEIISRLEDSFSASLSKKELSEETIALLNQIQEFIESRDNKY